MSKSSPVFSREQVEYLYKVFGTGLVLRPNAPASLEEIWYDGGVRAVLTHIESKQGIPLPNRVRE